MSTKTPKTKTDEQLLAKVYNLAGEVVGDLALPTKLFARPWNADLVHQVTMAMAANLRHNKAAVKNRGEVSGGGRKPWRQKGTGRARHGSSRSPLWRKGGVTHGPTAERDYAQKVSKKMGRAALAAVLSQKWRDGEIIFVDDLGAVAGKTKAARQVLERLAKVEGFRQLAYRRGRRALVAAPELSTAIARGFRNLPTVDLAEIRNLNPLQAMRSRYLVLSGPQASVEILVKRI